MLAVIFVLHLNFYKLHLSSNYASVRHVPSLDSISSVMDGLHLQVQEVRQVMSVHARTVHTRKLHSFA